jgi:RecB family exonuclease
MASTRRLWTGGHGADLREALVAATVMDASSLWIVPSELAARQVRRVLGARSRGVVAPVKIWCWSDLWQSIGEQAEVGPGRLSTAAAEAVFDEAIRRARARRRLGPLETMIDWPGYRRQLRARVAHWTRDEQHETRSRGGDNDAVAVAERLLFDEYRDLLRGLNAEDDAGFAVWASMQLTQKSIAALAGVRQVTILEWPSGSPAQWRFLHVAIRRAKSVHISLAHEEDPASRPVYEASSGIRQSLLEAGFVETVLAADLWRPKGLREVEQSLFRPREQTTGISAAQGIEIQGAPQGDGVARWIAHELQGLIETGTEPDDILVLFRHWSEQAERALEIARQWNLPVTARSSLPLNRDAAITALLLAAGLPISDWETTRLMRLLRHGHFQPKGLPADRPALMATAALLRKSRVFRGSRNILAAIDRMIQDAEEARDRTLAGAARVARTIIVELLSRLELLDKPRPWTDQVDQLFQMAHTLGIGYDDQKGFAQPALELLREVLEDQADIIRRTGHEAEVWTWPRFMAEIRSIVQRTWLTAAVRASGSILFTTLAEAAGARVPFVILADLVEGSFPSREAVEPFLSLRPGEQPSAGGRLAASREMLRFLSVLGTADTRISLVYPTTDSKGTELLRAGYLDDLLELLTPEARQACHRSIDRFDASLIDSPELAGSSSDRRTRATALAAARADDTALRHLSDFTNELGSTPEHPPAEGAAIALNVLRARLRHTPFGIHDGLLSDPRAIERITQQFGPEFTFSPSQLETYIECPFKFYSQYVLKLDAEDDRDELDEDFTARGSRLHDILEQLETLLIERRRSGGVLDQTVVEAEAAVALESHMRSELGQATEVEEGLEEIEQERLRLVVARYIGQSTSYLGDAQFQPVPHQLEVDFGGKGSDHPHLELGGDENAVRLRGKIDRIDLLEAPGGRAFRIIDYKSGSAPSSTDVREARLLQLPLYAMAVERVILAPEQIALRDVGYWGLKKEGFRSITFEEWDEVQAAVESYVLALVDRLRRGVFVVDSQVSDCESFCEFRSICRIRQVRSAGKSFDRVPAPELAIASPRRKSRSSEPRPAAAVNLDEDSP